MAGATVAVRDRRCRKQGKFGAAKHVAHPSLFAVPALPAGAAGDSHLAEAVVSPAGERGFLLRAIASDATRGAARKRIGRRGIRVATAKPRTPRPSATPRREMRFPRRRAGARQEACLPDGTCITDSLSAKRSPPRKTRPLARFHSVEPSLTNARLNAKRSLSRVVELAPEGSVSHQRSVRRGHAVPVTPPCMLSAPGGSVKRSPERRTTKKAGIARCRPLYSFYVLRFSVLSCPSERLQLCACLP